MQRSTYLFVDRVDAEVRQSTDCEVSSHSRPDGEADLTA